MRFSKLLLGIFAVFSMVTFASAKKDLILATGSEKGNYYPIGKDIQDVVAQDIKDKFGYNFQAVPSNGSSDNLFGMVDKKYSMGIVQADVLLYYAKKQPLLVNKQNIKVVMDLYPEYIHILIPKGWQPKQEKKGFFSGITSLFSKNEHKPVSIYTLKNQVVGAWGGSIVTANTISYFMRLNLRVKELSSKNRFNVNMPLIVVSGSGDKRIQKAIDSGRYFLISLNPNEFRNTPYRPANVTYVIKGKPLSIQTISIKSVLLARNYRSAKRRNAIIQVKKDIFENEDDLIDDGNSVFWAIVFDENKKGNRINWDYIDIK